MKKRFEQDSIHANNPSRKRATLTRIAPYVAAVGTLFAGGISLATAEAKTIGPNAPKRSIPLKPNYDLKPPKVRLTPERVADLLQARARKRQNVPFDASNSIFWKAKKLHGGSKTVQTRTPLATTINGETQYFGIKQKGSGLNTLDVYPIPNKDIIDIVPTKFNEDYHCGVEPNTIGVISLRGLTHKPTVPVSYDSEKTFRVVAGQTLPSVTHPVTPTLRSSAQDC